MIDTNLADLRQDYSKSKLSASSVSADPFDQFSQWMNEVLKAEIVEPTAMVLATVGADNKPSSRVVLLKGFDSEGFVFYSNYESRKGRALAENPYAAIHFFWPDLERQVNISGMVSRMPADDSDEYFRSRPYTSRVGAWASHQSEKLSSRIELVTRAAKFMVKYPTGNVPRPPYWGGYRLVPDRIEFWQGRESRLHDRICYDLVDGVWQISRLSP